MEIDDEEFDKDDLLMETILLWYLVIWQGDHYCDEEIWSISTIYECVDHKFVFLFMFFSHNVNKSITK